ncbi:hypothetical protein KGQ71_02530 [Patescibacteria group bacterium]|nr:hypothetical protein [Patescibacteria group bacterium]
MSLTQPKTGARNARRVGRPGFTYLELLIAISLFTVGMLSVLEIFPVNRRYLNQSADYTQAAYLAQEEMETIRGVSYASLTSGTYEPLHAVGSGPTDPLGQYQRQTTVTFIDSQNNWQNSATDTGLKRVDVTVIWSDRSIHYSYLLTSYVYQ